MGKSAILSVRIIGDGRDADKALDRTSRKLDDVGKRAAKSGVELSRMYQKLDAMSTAALKIGAVATSVASLTSHAAALGRSLVPLVGTLAVVPGAVAASAAAVGTFKVATAGFTDAVEAAGKGTKEFEKATEGMPRAMREAALAVKAVNDEFAPVKRQAQIAFWSGIDTLVRRTARGAMPQLRDGIVDVASAQNGLVRAFGQGVQSASRMGVIRAVFAATERTLRSLTPAVEPLTRGLATIVKGSVALIPGFSGAGSAAQKFATWAQKIVANGDLARWFRNGVAVARQLGSVLGSVVSIIGSVLKAASEAGGATGVGGLADSLGRLAKAVASPEIQKQMREAFTQANAVMKQAMSIVLALLPHIIRLGPAIMVAAAGWKAFSAAAALFRGLGMVGEVTRIGSALIGAGGSILRFKDGLTQAGAASSAFATTAVRLGGAARATALAIASTATAWTRAGAAAVAGAARQVAAWVATAGAAAMHAVRIAAAWVVAMGPVGWVIAAIAGIVAAFVLAYNKVGWFRDGVNAALGIVRNVIGVVGAFIGSAFRTAWNIASGIVRTHVTIVRTAMTGAKAAVDAVRKWIGDKISAAWKTASAGVEGFKSAVSRGMEVVRGIIEGVRDAVSRVLDLARSAASRVNPFNWFGASWSRAAVPSTMPQVGQPFYMTAAVIPSGPYGVDRSTSRVVSNVYNITIEGAVDKAGTARQLREILRADGIRDGRIMLGGEL